MPARVERRGRRVEARFQRGGVCYQPRDEQRAISGEGGRAHCRADRERQERSGGRAGARARAARRARRGDQRRQRASLSRPRACSARARPTRRCAASSTACSAHGTAPSRAPPPTGPRRRSARSRTRSSRARCRSSSAAPGSTSARCSTASPRCPPIDPAVREAVRALPVAEAYAALQAEDPERAAALNPADTTRVARALEVVRSTGKPLAHWQAQRVGGIGEAIELFPLVLLPDARGALRALRRAVRADARQRRRRGSRAPARPRPRPRPARSCARSACPRSPACLRGEWSREEALARGQQATRNYAKRQYTWFRRQPPEDWPRIETRKLRYRQPILKLYSDI